LVVARLVARQLGAAILRGPWWSEQRPSKPCSPRRQTAGSALPGGRATELPHERRQSGPSWSNLIANGVKVPLPDAGATFHEALSLDPGYKLSVPDLRQANPGLIGPILDLLTFYADLQLAMRQEGLKHAGDHVAVKHGVANSWADGAHVLIGEDAIDFDITLAEVNVSDDVATVVVRHVPPAQPGIRLPAEWMRVPVADAPNNWVQVEKENNGKYLAEAGKETFDVEMKINLASGKMLSATMDNPVEAVGRECADAALTSCGELSRHQIRRQIEIH